MKLALTSLTLALLTLCGSAQADSTLPVDVGGIQSRGLLGDPTNTVLTLQLGAFAHVTGFQWNVDLQSFDPSWLSELTLSFSGSDSSAGGLLFTPGLGDDFYGSRHYSGQLDLLGEGLDFVLGADGLLRLEFSEAASDGLQPDGLWASGQLGFTVATPVPEPASWGLLALGLGALGATMRRRQKA